MVSLPPSTESRAGSLALVGGELALDFANTASGRGSADHKDHIRSADNLLEWARHARALGPADGDWLRQARRSIRRWRRACWRARSTCGRTFTRRRRDRGRRPAPPERSSPSPGPHARCLSRAHLTPFGGNFVWAWTPEAAPVEAVLGPIALSAMTTLLQADLTRVKQCHGDKCGWLFFDTTKNRSRRWCEMEICGNRAKQRRLVARSRRA